MNTQTFQHKDILRIYPDLSARSLVSWSEKSLLTPDHGDATGRGTVRRYSFDNVMQAGVIRELFILGFGFRDIRTFFTEHWKNEMKRFNYDCVLIMHRQTIRASNVPGRISPNFSARVFNMGVFKSLGASAVLEDSTYPLDNGELVLIGDAQLTTSVVVVNVSQIHTDVMGAG